MRQLFTFITMIVGLGASTLSAAPLVIDVTVDNVVRTTVQNGVTTDGPFPGRFGYTATLDTANITVDDFSAGDNVALLIAGDATFSSFGALDTELAPVASGVDVGTADNSAFNLQVSGQASNPATLIATLVFGDNVSAALGGGRSESRSFFAALDFALDLIDLSDLSTAFAFAGPSLGGLANEEATVLMASGWGSTCVDCQFFGGSASGAVVSPTTGMPPAVSVPEPASMGMIGLGLASLISLRRRRSA